jgi:hypothetical protein
MHALIGITVQADTKEEALKEAEAFFNSHLLDQYGIDYGSTHQANSYEVDELKSIDQAVELMDEDNGRYIGRDFADLLVEITEDSFKAHMEKIRTALAEESDEALWSGYPNGFNSLTRYYFHQAGAYGGGEIRLYDAEWGSGIRSQRDYDKVIERWENPSNGVPYWIIPMDIHF